MLARKRNCTLYIGDTSDLIKRVYLHRENLNAELLKLISSNPEMISYIDKNAADKTVKAIFAP